MSEAWLSRLAERCAYMSLHCSTGGGPPVAAELSKILTVESQKRGIEKNRLTEMIIKEWKKRGITK